MGIVVYKDNNNWGGCKEDSSKIWKYVKSNGAYSESYGSATDKKKKWLHCIVTITSTSLNLKTYDGTTLVRENTVTIPSTHSKIGIECSWATSNNARIKNLSAILL